MKSSNRWLYIFGGAIGLLVIISVVLALTIGSPSNQKMLEQGTPAGTVQRFLLSLKDNDYTTAQTYLTSQDNRTDLNVLQNRPFSSGEQPDWKATLGKTDITGSKATVDVTVDVFRPSGPFNNSIDTIQVTFFLSQVDGAWKITSPLNIWWLY